MTRATGFAAALLLLCLFSCTPLRKEVSTLPNSEVNRLLVVLAQNKNNLESFRGVGKLRMVRGSKAQTMRIVWIGSESGNLRLETIGPWGQSPVTFLLKDTVFYVHKVDDKVCYKGKATARNLSRILSIPIGGDELSAILSGQPPLTAFHEAKIKVLEGDGKWCLYLYTKWNRIIEKMFFKDDRKTVERVEFFDRFGAPTYTTTFSEFRDVDGYLLSHKIKILHTNGLDLSLDIEKFRAGVTIPEKAFILELPDTKVVDLGS